MKRSEIEKKWLEECNVRSGTYLCSFSDRYNLYAWKPLWNKQYKVFISDYFKYDNDWEELSYLTRALSLHMLLDNMGLD